MVFATILKGVIARMSEKTLSYMYKAMRTDDVDKNRYSVVKFRSESYTLQDDKRIKRYKPPITVMLVISCVMLYFYILYLM